MTEALAFLAIVLMSVNGLMIFAPNALSFDMEKLKRSPRQKYSLMAVFFSGLAFSVGGVWHDWMALLGMILMAIGGIWALVEFRESPDKTPEQ